MSGFQRFLSVVLIPIDSSKNERQAIWKSQAPADAMTFESLRRTIYAYRVPASLLRGFLGMKQVMAFMVLVIAFGASGQVFGIDRPYEPQDEVVQPVQLDHFEAVVD